mmetsp:Transcript_113325/g.303995  ORF Transcript_113325/g.303995 Transcript_113325/m.303995 type:complete len:381 (-) Transcript_113325:25-1167(-)
MIFHECAESVEELDSIQRMPTDQLSPTRAQMSVEAPHAISAFSIPRQISVERFEEKEKGGCDSPSRRGTFVMLTSPAVSSTAPATATGHANGHANRAARNDQGTPGPHEESIPRVAATVREHWRRRREDPDLDCELGALLQQGFGELEEWTQPPIVRRMLRAMGGDEEEAAGLLCRAIESRARRRELYRTLRLPGEPACDMRVIGYDLDRRPTIYLCCRNQQGGLVDILPQVFLTFEAAVRLCADLADGQVALIADMRDFSARRNMDLAAFQDLQASFGSVYADRLRFLLIVDFSWVAQAVWRACKPLLSERTRQKISFVDEAKARELVEARFPAKTRERIFTAFDINRDPGSTGEQRRAHALRTSICDVPLGSVELRSS